MRILILAFAASSVSLSGCGEEQSAGNMTGSDQVASARETTNGDVTSIDAATGADANMAADVDLNRIDESEEGNRAAGRSRAASRPAAPSAGNNSAETAPEPAEAANAAANSTD